MYDIDIIKNDLKNNMSEYRYNHSLMVANEARELALRYGYDADKAYLAGLVHDIAKEFSYEDNLKYIEKYNLSKDLLKEENRNIMHADIGSVVVRDLYDLDDDMSKAILYHTIGNKDMNILAKIVFIADKIGRENNNVIDKYKKAAYEDIDKAIIMYLEDGKDILANKGKVQHPDSIELLDYLKNE